MFKNARVGDKVYDIRRGSGKITDIIRGASYPIMVKFECGVNESYTIDGYDYNAKYGLPSLYWSKPEIIAPPPPRRKVKTTRWINIYSYTVGSRLYTSEKEARGHAGDCLTQCIPIEIEEEI